MWWLRIQLSRLGRRRRDPEFEDVRARPVRRPRARRRVPLPQR